MNKSGFEIERKFLIQRVKEIIPDETRWDIVQTYLTKNSPEIQRRVRKITENECMISYFYTEKKFLSSGVREENECEISEKEYNSLLREADKNLRDVIKTRRIFPYDGLKLEMDEYPFSEKCATVEAEIENITDKINFPDFIHVIKEVTGDSRYSNASLALNQCFPE